MVKLMVLLRRRPGSSLAEFRDHYENRHVPLIERLNPLMAGYTRSYVDHASAFQGGMTSWRAEWAPDYDVVTEIWYADRARMEQAAARMTTVEAAAAIAADEEKFLDRSAKRFFIVEERGDTPR